MGTGLCPMGHPRAALRHAVSAAFAGGLAHCAGGPGLHGKEGVTGSSPVEGLADEHWDSWFMFHDSWIMYGARMGTGRPIQAARDRSRAAMIRATGSTRSAGSYSANRPA